MDIRKTLAASVCAVLLAACSVCRALADSQGAGKSASAPVVVLGVASGIVVGTPIAATRMSGRDMNAIIQAYDGDTFAWKCFGRPVAIPLGILEGTIKGCIAGTKNAIRYSKDKPFSKEAFSLEDLE
jgi:hypothetical protein